MDNLDTKTLGRAQTPYGNIAQTLCGQVVCGDPQEVMSQGRILVGAGNPEAIASATEEGGPGPGLQPGRFPDGRHRVRGGLRGGVPVGGDPPGGNGTGPEPGLHPDLYAV